MMNNNLAVSTANYPNWPSFLVSGATAIVKWHKGQLSTIASNPSSTGGAFYGITWDEKYLYYSRGSERVVFGRDELVAASLEPDYVINTVFPGHFVDAHQIHYHDGKVYLTVTARNAVAAVSVHNQQECFYNWTGINRDTNHINAIWRDGDFWWVNYHNYSEKPASAFNSSQIVKLSSNFSSILDSIRIGMGVHNVVRIGDFLYVCSSAENKFLVFNLNSHSVVDTIESLDWVRGMAVTDDYIILGSSEVHADRRKRLQGNATIYLLCRHTIKIIDKLTIYNLGPSHELRCISHNDLAHNGIVYPGAL